MARPLRMGRDLWTIAVTGALLGAVYLLPPDTSLAEVRRSGQLRACVPTAAPPLVTGDPAAPGLDIELLTEIARGLGLTLQPTPIAAMGRDFDPRGWRITRAQCDVLAGGVVRTEASLGFLDTTEPHAETGWALLAPGPIGALADSKVGVLTGIGGLDRLALSRHLREARATVVIARNAEELVAGLREGRFEIAATDALLAEQLAAEHGWQIQEPGGELRRLPLALGLWKGDLTLKRAIAAELEAIRADGRQAALLVRYGGGSNSGSSSSSSTAR